MRIELATIEDAPRILALQKAAYRAQAEIYDEFFLPPLTQTLEDLQGEFHAYTVYKATLGTDLVGSVRTLIRDGTCYIGRHVVHPSVQNQGIGSMLLSCMEHGHSEAARFEVFTGHLSVRSLFLYRKLGYKEFKRQKVTDSLTLVFLEKRIRTN